MWYSTHLVVASLDALCSVNSPPSPASPYFSSGRVKSVGRDYLVLERPLTYDLRLWWKVSPLVWAYGGQWGELGQGRRAAARP